MRPRIAALVAALAWAGMAVAEPAEVAFFGVTFLNASPEPTSAAEEARLASVEAQIAEALAGSGAYRFVETGAVAEKADLYANLAQCNGCDARLAAELGADLALTAEVQKTSNLILHITIYLRDAETGALVGGGSADIRGNTDESWRRGVSYILRNRILNR